MKGRLGIIGNGIFNENPVLRLVLGTCPTLALTSSASTALGMGAAATFVLICSNMVISALRNIIPDKVRIPAFITVIAGFVSVIEMLMKAFLPDLYDSLGVYLPLIVVNCIILGRAEMFACKNKVLDSICDGIGCGIGFTLALLCMSTIRELIGAGSLFGVRIIPEEFSVGILTKAPGGFFVFGLLIAILAAVSNRSGKPKAVAKCEGGCPGCPGQCSDAVKEG